jgi:glycosyltransferase involved in cell wall biosynthesis
MACGLPCIVGNLPVLLEIVNNENGVIIQENNSFNITKSIKELQKNIAYRKKLSKNAQLKIEKHFTMKEMLQSYINMYKINSVN